MKRNAHVAQDQNETLCENNRNNRKVNVKIFNACQIYIYLHSLNLSAFNFEYFCSVMSKIFSNYSQLKQRRLKHGLQR